MKISIFFLSVLTAIFMFSCAVSQNVSNSSGGGPVPSTPELSGIFVSVSGADTNAGTNRSFPVLTISIAVSNALANGITNIYVSAGTYRPGSGLDSSLFSGVLITNSGLNISGGWDANFQSVTGYSVLDGTNNLVHVLSVFDASNIVLQGLSVINGNAGGGNITNSEGAGLYLSNVMSCVFSNLIVSNNAALLDGAGIWMSGSSNVFYGYVFNNTTDINNGYGGGLCLGAGSFLNSIDGVFNANTARYGGGILLNSGSGLNQVAGSYRNNYGFYGGGGIALMSSHSNQVNADVCSNMSAGYGGGYYVSSGDNAIRGSVTSNYSTMYCGGVYINSGNRNLITATVTDNRCYYYGGGIYIYSGSYSNSVVSMVLRNVSTGSYGGGISDYGTSTAITNCLIVNNSASSGGGGLHNMYDNSFNTNGSLIFNNTPNDYLKW